MTNPRFPFSRPFIRYVLFLALLGISVLPAKLNAQSPISFGQTRVNLQMVVARDTILTFAGTSNQVISIQMTEISGDFNPTFDLMSPSGAVLRNVTHASSARLLQYSLPVTGTYLIICRDRTGQYAGGYNLTLIDCLGDNPSDDERGEIVSGQIRSANMVPTDIDVFWFTGSDDMLATIQMTEISGDFNPTFDLLSPTGAVLKTETGPSTLRLAFFALPAKGAYRIVCRDSTGNYTGGYRLSLTLIPVGDGDGDGLPDTWEQQYFSDLRYGSEDDPDNDLLKNSVELARKTNPNKADTDDDGFKDGLEIAAGSDPLDPNSKPSTDMRIVVKTVDVEFITVAGYRYELQASRDLQSWSNLASPIAGDNTMFRTNIDVRGTDFRWFRAPATLAQ